MQVYINHPIPYKESTWLTIFNSFCCILFLFVFVLYFFNRSVTNENGDVIGISFIKVYHSPGSLICLCVMFVSPHIICVYMLSVTNKLYHCKLFVKIPFTHIKRLSVKCTIFRRKCNYLHSCVPPPPPPDNTHIYQNNEIKRYKKNKLLVSFAFSFQGWVTLFYSYFYINELHSTPRRSDTIQLPWLVSLWNVAELK